MDRRHIQKRNGNLPAKLLSRDAVNVLASLALGLLPVNKVQTPGLDLTVNEGTSEASHDLLGLLVALGLACEIERNNLSNSTSADL